MKLANQKSSRTLDGTVIRVPKEGYMQVSVQQTHTGTHRHFGFTSDLNKATILESLSQGDRVWAMSQVNMLKHEEFKIRRVVSTETFILSAV